MDTFNEEEARSIREAQELLEKASLKSDLAFIKCQLAFLPQAITRLETSGLTLIESVSIVNEVMEKIDKLPEPKGRIFKEKMTAVLKKNSVFKTLQDVAKVQGGNMGSMPSEWTPSDIAELKYCPITSVDVERSFSVFKHVFTDRKHNFTEQNLEKTIVSNCFYARKRAQ